MNDEFYDFTENLDTWISNPLDNIEIGNFLISTEFKPNIAFPVNSFYRLLSIPIVYKEFDVVLDFTPRNQREFTGDALKLGGAQRES